MMKRSIPSFFRYVTFTAAAVAVLIFPCMGSLPAVASEIDSGLTVPYYLADDAGQPLTVMPITPAEHRLQHERWVSSPRARMDSKLQQKFATATSFTSVSNLNKVPNYTDRNQGSAGNCWVWGSTAAMEGEYYNQFGSTSRISIQYFDSNYNNGVAGSWAGCGGYITTFVSFYNSKKLCIPWSNANAYYRDATRTCSMGTAVAASLISTTPSYTITSITGSQIPTFGMGQSAAIAGIKNVINQGKVPVFCFYLSEAGWTSFRNFWRYQPESALWSDFTCGSVPSGGHAVACVGYNDDDANPENHYWIMLNSWGTNSLRPNGLFRVKMYYNYNCAAAAGYAMTQWWTVDTTFGEVAKPASPTLTSPAAGATVSGTSITFTWNASTGATGYWLSVGRTSDGSSKFSQYVGNVTTYTVTGFPNDGTQYGWAVAAGNNAGWSAGSATRTFVNGTAVTVPLPPVPSSPANNATVNGTSITFTWNASTGATGYWLSVTTTSGILFYSSYVGSATTRTLSGFPNNGTQYRWSVAAGNSAGWSPGASAITFTNGTGVTVPSAPVLSTPAGSSTVSGTSIPFTWVASPGATMYWLSVTTTTGTRIYSGNVGNVTTHTVIGFSDNGTQYRWSAAAGNSVGWSAGAPAITFTNGP